LLGKKIRFARLLHQWDADPKESAVFPHDVVSVVTKTKDMPKWIRDLNGVAQLSPVPGFTKAAHALAHFADLNGTPGFAKPKWYAAVDEMESQYLPGEGDDEKRPVLRSHADTPLLSAADTDVVEPSIMEAFTAGPGARMIHEFGRVRVDSEFGRVRVDSSTSDNFNAEISRRGTFDSLEGTRSDPDLSSLRTPLLSGSQAIVSENKDEHFGKILRNDEGEEKTARTAIVYVQPKTKFANERTFLEWLHYGVMLALLGVVVMHSPQGANSMVSTGRALIALALAIIAYALFVFTWRADLLDEKAIADYYDPYGPYIMVFCLLLVVWWAALDATGLLDKISGTTSEGMSNS